MKFSKPFQGVRDGEIYPEKFDVGDECPPELLDAALSLDVIDGEAEQDAGSADTTPSKKKAK